MTAQARRILVVIQCVASPHVLLSLLNYTQTEMLISVLAYVINYACKVWGTKLILMLSRPTYDE